MFTTQSEFNEKICFLEDMAKAVIESSRVAPDQSVAGSCPNTTGGTLIRPGGRNCYPSFWIRDFAMSLECGLIPMDELEHALRLTAKCQSSEGWQTKTGSFIPKGAIADHINFDAAPIYFAGTYDPEKQGQPYGYYPCLDDHFYFVEMAWQLVTTGKNEAILRDNINGLDLLARLDGAFSVPMVKDASDLIWCDEETRGISFGFTDSIVHTGYLLFCSILRCRAARHLADLHEICGNDHTAKKYRAIVENISNHLSCTFAHDSGLLKASTGKSAQADVWGSAFAVYADVLPKDDAKRISQTLSNALSQGTIAWKGNIRHVPTDGDFSDTTAWEQTTSTRIKNQYQNGAYWNTPTGWVCYAIAQVNPKTALALAMDYLDELKAGDFRQGDEYGSPYECIHPDGDHKKNAIYLTSVTCPLAAFRRLGNDAYFK